MFSSLVTTAKLLINRVLPTRSAVEPVVNSGSNADPLPETRVVTEALCSENAQSPLADTAVAPKVIDSRSSARFRRTREEIRLGRSIEEAQAMRSTKKPEGKSPQHGKRGKDKAKRFKRTSQEIEAGLSIGQAAALRGTALPKESRKHTFIERKVLPVVVEKTPLQKLEETLPPKIQARARSVRRYRDGGGKAVIATDLFAQIEQAVAAGKVTKCPPCTDSDGYNHLTQKEGA